MASVTVEKQKQTVDPSGHTLYIMKSAHKLEYLILRKEIPSTIIFR